MHILSVGKLYIPGKTSWPEGAEYNWYDNGHELRLFYRKPSKREIEDIRSGRAEFGLFHAEGIVFLLAKFGNQNWLDAPYHLAMLPLERRPNLTEEPGPETRALLQVLLVDASTGILHVIRAMTLSPEFTLLLHNLVREQTKNVLTRAEYDVAVSRAYRFSTDDMVKSALMHCEGGM